MGWMNRIGWTEYKNCPSIFFILWGYIDHVYKSVLTYILKNYHQHSHGFQNLMRSWVSWSKISKLPLVDDFQIFGSKLVYGKSDKRTVKPLQSPFGVHREFTLTSAEGASLRMDGWDGWDGVSKVSCIFFYTSRVYRSCIYVLIYIQNLYILKA